MQDSIRSKEEENQRMQQKMRSLQDQVNLYRAMLPCDSTPALTLDTSAPYTAPSDDLTPVQEDQTLVVPATSRSGSTSSAYAVSLMSADVTTTGSRPVSMVSATSETMSDDASATADDERAGGDDDDEMLQTLTAESLSECSLLLQTFPSLAVSRSLFILNLFFKKSGHQSLRPPAAPKNREC